MNIVQLARVGEKIGLSGTKLQEFIENEKKKAEEAEKQAREREDKAHDREEKRKEAEHRQKVEEHRRQKEQMEDENKRKEEYHRRQREQKEDEHRRAMELLAEKARTKQETQSSDANQLVGRPKLPKFDEATDDMDAYLERFERIATSQRWDKNNWAVCLSPLLTGKALEVYTGMPVDDIHNYDMLKELLLKRYQLTEEGFRRKFRESKFDKGETTYQYVARLRRYLNRWIELTGIKKDYESLFNLILQEQYLLQCPKELTVFLRERTPADINELVKLSEKYLEAHGSNKNAACQGVVQAEYNTPKPGPQTERYCYICYRTNHIARDCFYRDKAWYNNGGHNGNTHHGPTNKSASMYPNQVENQKQKSGAADHWTRADSRMPTCTGAVNGEMVTVLRDTGCSTAAVRARIVQADQQTNMETVCVLIDGTERKFPIAKLYVDTPYYTGYVEAMVMDNPLYDLILGNIPGIADQPKPGWKAQGNAVKTRAQVKKEEQLTTLDVPQIAIIEIYIHRVGRTARAGRKGRAISLVGEEERRMLKEIVKKARNPVKSRTVPADVIMKYKNRISKLEKDIKLIEQQEKVLRATENQMNKAQRLLQQKEEDMADRKRSWFQTHAERKEAAESKKLSAAVLPKSVVLEHQKNKIKNKLQMKKPDSAEDRAMKEIGIAQAYAARVAKRGRKETRIRTVVEDDDDDRPKGPKPKKRKKSTAPSFTKELSSTSQKSLKKFRHGPEMSYQERKEKSQFKRGSKPGKSFKSKSRYKRR